MSKKNFSFLVLTVVSALLFSLGMCMCLLPQWNLFKPGVVVTALGLAALIVLALVRWVMAGKPTIQVDFKKVGKAAYCVVSLLVLGAGMAMIMAFEGLLIPGLLVGVAGVLLILGMIPVLRGLK